MTATAASSTRRAWPRCARARSSSTPRAAGWWSRRTAPRRAGPARSAGTTETMKKFVEREKHPNLIPCETMKDLVGAIKRPRKFIILVKAGPAVDAVTKELIDAGINTDDIVVDCGNSLWTDTIRRERDYADKCKFFGSGVSGGEVGARFGPSMMPGGAPESWKHLKTS